MYYIVTQIIQIEIMSSDMKYKEASSLNFFFIKLTITSNTNKTPLFG